MRYPDDVPTLTDGVVTLRAHTTDDIGPVTDQGQDPESTRWTAMPYPYTRAHAEHYVTERVPQAWVSGTEFNFAVEYDGRYVGTVSLFDREHRRAEIGYAARPSERGKGAMARGVALILDWAFSERYDTVIWWAGAGNWHSWRLVWRQGFTFGGTLPAWLVGREGLEDAWVATLHRSHPRTPKEPWAGPIN